MRSLSSFSRALSVAAIVAAAALILGGAYFVGYVGELQRSLSDPAATPSQAAHEIAAIEKALGHGGFLKTYRNFRLTGDAQARLGLTRDAIEADRAIGRLRKLYAGNPTALDALREAASVGEAFVHVAQSAPDTGTAALRGTASMNDLAALPQPPQLEASYLALRTALDRLRAADQQNQLGGVAYALNWSQVLIIAAVCALAIALLIGAGTLQLGIVQPLKALEQSLTSLGDGAVTQKVWGTERTDEFGTLARAGEKLRRSLTETTALQTLADKGELRLTIEGEASLLLQRLANDVTTATAALKSAAADFAKLQDGNRQNLETALGSLTASAATAGQAAATLHEAGTTTIAETRNANTAIADAVAARTERLDLLADRFERGNSQLEQMVATVKTRANAAVDELANSAASLHTAAEGVAQIHSTLAQSLETVSLEAGDTTGKVRTLAARLSEAIGLVDERLSRKLAALDALEQAVTKNLAHLRAKAEEASQMMAESAGTLQQRASIAGDKEKDDLATAIARLDQIAERLATPAKPEARDDLQGLANTLQSQLETVRGEIRDLAIRMTEERLLATGDSGFALSFASDAPPLPRTEARTLADVPADEIMARLKDLAAEMTASHDTVEEPAKEDGEDPEDQTAALKSVLGKFAIEVKDLAANADRAARLKAMGRALDQHADDIEAHMPAASPSSALSTELAAITSELRTIAAHAQGGGTKDGQRLRESAIEVGARAESLFTYLNRTHPDAHSSDDEDFAATPDAAADIAALAHLIDRLESRATSLAAPKTNLTTNGAIHTVFESIGRLNNIATALARAGTHRQTAH